MADGVLDFHVRMQQRRDASSNWTSINPILANGELGIETDNTSAYKFKVGDGSHVWTDLPYIFTGGTGATTYQGVMIKATGTSVVTSGTAEFGTTAGGNVTFGLTGSTITASASFDAIAGSQTTQWPNAVYLVGANTSGQTSYTSIQSLYLSGDQNMTLGGTSNTIKFYAATAFSNSSQLTGTFLTTAAQVSHTHGNLSLSLNGLSGTYSSASSGITFSLTNSTHAHDYIPIGNSTDYATSILDNTFALISHSHSAVSLSLDGLSGTYSSASNGLTLSLTNSTHVHSFVNQINGSSGSISLNTGSSLSSSANASGITFGLASNITTVLQSAGAYLTTAANSTHTHGNVSLSLTNISGTYSSASNGLTISLTGPTGGGGSWELEGTKTSGTTGTAFSTLFLEAYNNITLSGNSNSIRFSVGNYIDASDSGSVYFQNSNGLSWGSTTGASSTSITANYAAIKNLVLSGTTTGTMATISSGTMTLAGGNNITLSQSGNAVTIIGAAAGTGGAGTGFTSTSTTGSVMVATLNSNGLSAGIPAWLTAGGTGGGAAIQGSGTYSQNSGTVQFQTGNGATFGLSSNGVMTLSYTMPSGSVYFTNGSNVTWSTSADSISTSVMLTAGDKWHDMTISGNTSGTLAAISSGTLTLAGGNNITLSQSGNAITISAGTGAGGPYNVLAVSGATANTSGTVVFLNSNSITFGMSDSTQITASFSQSTHSHATYAATNHTHGNLSLSLASLSGTYSSASDGLTISLTAINSSNFLNTSQSGNLYFTNSYGVSWSSSTSSNSTSIMGSIATTYAGTGFTSTSTSGSIPVATLNSAGLSMGIPAWLTAGGTGGGAALKGSGTYTQNSGTIEFANSNSITFGLTANSMTASVARGNVYFQDSGVSWSSSVNGLSTSLTGNVKTIEGSVYVNDVLFSFGDANYFFIADNTNWVTNTFHSHVNFSMNNTSIVNLAASQSYASNSTAVTRKDYIFYANLSTLYLQQGKTLFDRTDFNNSTSTLMRVGLDAEKGLLYATDYSSYSSSHTTNDYWIPNKKYVDDNIGGGGFQERISGNTSGTTAMISSGTLTLAGGNNITLSQNGNAITISGANIGGAQTGISGIGVSNTTYTSGTVIYSAQSNITLGSSTDGASQYVRFSVGDYITTARRSTDAIGLNTSISSGYVGSTLALAGNSSGLSLSVPAWITTYAAQTYQPVAFSGSNTSTTASTISFGNSNNMNFYITNGSLVGSFSESTHAHSFVNQINGSSGSISLNTGSSLSSSANASGITFGLASNITTALQSAGAYLTTAAQSNQVVNSFNGSTGQISLVTGSGMSTTTNASTLTFGLRSDISTAWSGQTTANSSKVIQINGSTGSFSFATGSSLSSSANASTITWGLASNITTALQSYNANYLTSQSAQAFSADASSTFQTLSFQNSNGVSFSNNAGALRVTHDLQYTSNTSNITVNAMNTNERASFVYKSNLAVSNSAGSFTFQTLNFSNANNVTWGTSAGSIITASVAAPGAAAENNWITLGGNVAGNSSASGSTINWVGGNNITLSGTNGSQITIVGGAGGGAAIKGSGTYSQNTGTVEFANSNGLTFGLSNNGTMTASYSVPSGSVYFQNASGISWSTSADSISTSISGIFNATGTSTSSTAGTALAYSLGTGGLTMSVPAWITTYSPGAGIAISASDQLYTSGTVQFRGTNVTINTSAGGQYVDLSVAAPAAGAAISAAGSSVSNGTVAFSNSNSVSFGMNGSTVTASVRMGNAYFQDASGISWSSSTNGVSTSLTASHNALSKWGLVGNTGNNSSGLVIAGGLTLHGGDNITLSGGSAAGNISIYGSALSRFSLVGNTAGATTGSLTAGILYLSGGNNITLSGNGASVNISAGAGGGGVAIADSASTITNQTAVFSNSNGISFGINGSTITGAHNAISRWSLVGNSAGNATGPITNNGLTLAGADFVTLSGNSAGNIISISVNSGSFLGTGATQSFFYTSASSQFPKGWSLGTSTGGSTSGTTTQNISNSLYLVAGSNMNLSGQGSSIVLNAIPQGSVYFADIAGFSWTSTTAANATTFALKTS